MSAAELGAFGGTRRTPEIPSGGLRSSCSDLVKGCRCTLNLDGLELIANTESRDTPRFQDHVSGRFGDRDGGWHRVDLWTRRCHAVAE